MHHPLLAGEASLCMVSGRTCRKLEFLLESTLPEMPPSRGPSATVVDPAEPMDEMDAATDRLPAHTFSPHPPSDEGLMSSARDDVSALPTTKGAMFLCWLHPLYFGVDCPGTMSCILGRRDM